MGPEHFVVQLVLEHHRNELGANINNRDALAAHEFEQFGETVLTYVETAG